MEKVQPQLIDVSGGNGIPEIDIDFFWRVAQDADCGGRAGPCFQTGQGQVRRWPDVIMPSQPLPAFFRQIARGTSLLVTGTGQSQYHKLLL